MEILKVFTSPSLIRRGTEGEVKGKSKHKLLFSFDHPYPLLKRGGGTD
jgi:hypothetical protein